MVDGGVGREGFWVGGGWWWCGNGWLTFSSLNHVIHTHPSHTTDLSAHVRLVAKDLLHSGVAWPRQRIMVNSDE